MGAPDLLVVSGCVFFLRGKCALVSVSSRIVITAFVLRRHFVLPRSSHLRSVPVQRKEKAIILEDWEGSDT